MPEYPIRVPFGKKPMKPGNRPAKPVTQGDLDRQARRQGDEERSESKVLKRAKGGGTMKKNCGGSVKKMAKGGLAMAHKSADGVAKKGHTKAMRPAMKGRK